MNMHGNYFDRKWWSVLFLPLSHMYHLKTFGFRDPSPLEFPIAFHERPRPFRISNSLRWEEYGYFLEPHINTQLRAFRHFELTKISNTFGNTWPVICQLFNSSPVDKIDWSDTMMTFTHLHQWRLISSNNITEKLLTFPFITKHLLETPSKNKGEW